MAGHFISQYFGLGIAVAIAGAFFFPYTAASLHPLATAFLFLLMFLSGLTVDWSKLRHFSKYPGKILLGNLFLFIVIPLIVFFTATALLTNELYIYGIVFAALCPTAIVAPFFTGIVRGNKELSFLILVSSSLISPFIIPPMLTFLAGDYLAISSTLLFKEIMIFVPIPLLAAFFIKRYFLSADKLLTKHLPILNFFLLAILIFILFGVSMTKLHFNYIQIKELGALLFISFLQNFSFLLLLGPLQKRLGSTEEVISFFTSASMKNIAIASTILLLYSPKAAIAPALGFIAHIFLFTPFFLRPLLKISLKK